MIDSHRSHYALYCKEKSILLFCFASRKTRRMKQESYRFRVIFKREKEWWCVIVYNPQALGLNVFGLMKWIPYSHPSSPTRQSSPGQALETRQNRFVMTSAKLVHTCTNQIYSKESHINVNNLCHAVIYWSIHDDRSWLEGQENRPYKTTNKTLSHKQTKVYLTLRWYSRTH